MTSGFFVPDNPARGSVPAALAEIARTTLALGGPAVVLAGGAGLVLGLAALARGRWRSVLPLTLASAGALPFLAFYDGHPLRVRYMVPLVAAAGVLGAVAVARLPRRAQAIAAVLLGVWTVTTRPPSTRTPRWCSRPSGKRPTESAARR